MKLVFAGAPYYENPIDMSWEEEHVCSLCNGAGCRVCDDPPPTTIKIPLITKTEELKKKYWEIEEEKMQQRKAEAMKKELPWIISLIKKDWGRP